MSKEHIAVTIDSIDSELDEIGRQLGTSRPRSLVERYKLISETDMGERFHGTNFFDDQYGADWINFCRKKYG